MLKIYIYIYIYPVHPEMIHRNNPKHEIFRFDIQSEMAIETEFKTLLCTQNIFITFFSHNPKYSYEYF